MEVKRKRGRPRQYDEDSALQSAAEVFWVKGFSATSLDDLADAMEMNRPSIYRAFGDKQSIYRKVLKQFCQEMEAGFARTMLVEPDLRRALTGFYRDAVAVYTSGEQARGCLVMSTAVAAAVCHPDIQTDLLNVIRGLDRKMAVRMQEAIDDGQLTETFDAQSRAVIAQGVLHSLSLRARAGESRIRLNRLISSGVEMVVSA